MSMSVERSPKSLSIANSPKAALSAPAFAALGDATRLALVVRLSDGQPHSIAQLTAGTRLTRQGISKHLRVLHGAGIVRCVRRGRESLFEFDPKPIEGMREYLESVSAQWDQALARLKSFVEDAAPMQKSKEEMASDEALLKMAYRSFNERDIEAVLSLMQEDVDWADGSTGGRVLGRAAVREYWLNQWANIDPKVEPVGFEWEEDGRVTVSVHQVVRELDGQLLVDRMVEHLYAVHGGLIRSMHIIEKPTQ